MIYLTVKLLERDPTVENNIHPLLRAYSALGYRPKNLTCQVLARISVEDLARVQSKWAGYTHLFKRLAGCSVTKKAAKTFQQLDFNIDIENGCIVQ